MNPYRTYKEATTTESTRIDMLLSLFDRAIERLEAALTALREKQISTATKLLLRVQLLVRGLSAGVDPKYKEAGELPSPLRIRQPFDRTANHRTYGSSVESASHLARRVPRHPPRSGGPGALGAYPSSQQLPGRAGDGVIEGHRRRRSNSAEENDPADSPRNSQYAGHNAPMISDGHEESRARSKRRKEPRTQ